VTKRPSASTKKRVATRSGRLSTQLRDLILAAAGQGEALKKALRLLQSAVEADGSTALLFNEQDHSFRITEQLGLSAKQRRGLRDILPSVIEFAGREGTPRFPTKNSGLVFIFTESEFRQRGISSAFVYYLVSSRRLVSALVFCRETREFDKSAIKVLDSVASLVALLAEIRLDKEKAKETVGSVNLDGLTGLYNHLHFQENLANELLKSQRFRYKVSLLMIDIDHFKQINDKYGHPRGDATLRELSQIIKKTVRAYDVPARYGGEEFAVILPHADHDQALRVAERMRRAVMAHPFRGPSARAPLQVTVSIGVASYPANAKTKVELIDRADQALYLAKSEGRNRVCRSLANSTELIKVGWVQIFRNG
jgi:diguanylate cyclase (GGDEF)-like protein